MNRSLDVLLVLTALDIGLEHSSSSLANRAQESATCMYEVRPKDSPSDGILFVDRSRTGRSGHLGQALAEYQDGNVPSSTRLLNPDHRAGCLRRARLNNMAMRPHEGLNDRGRLQLSITKLTPCSGGRKPG